MIVMPSNSGHHKVHYWQGKYGGLGHLYAPGGERGPFDHLPYALDNGAFAAWTNDEEWDAAAFCALLEWARKAPSDPMWVVVPDAVGDPGETLRRWETWAPRIRTEYGWPLAMAVQDGMGSAEVRACEPDVVFVGGTTDWKWETVPRWARDFERVHVGRCNRPQVLYRLSMLAIESCDGTGWFRGDQVQTEGLRQFLEDQAAGKELMRYLDEQEPLLR